MASLCRRVIQLSLRSFSVSSSHCAKKKLIADPLELATGLEKREMLANLAGNDDPFNIKMRQRGPGTKEEPNLIPSAFDARIIGCICEPDAQHIKWMWLHKGTPKRCSCGAWYKLIEAAPL